MPELATLPRGRDEDRGVFVTTHWSVVLTAGESASPRADAALEALCRAYWYPIYVYVRRKGHGTDEAQDLTQEFFACLLRNDVIRSADRTKGKFRSFLLGALEHFLAREWTKAHRQKRGGGAVPVSLDAATAEERYQLEPADEATPDKAFLRQWALAVLERTLDRLGAQCTACGKANLFAQLRPVLSGESTGLGYAELGQRLGMSEGAVRVAIHRMRQCYTDLLRDEIAQTVATRNEIEEEIRFLLQVLSG